MDVAYCRYYLGEQGFAVRIFVPTRDFRNARKVSKFYENSQVFLVVLIISNRVPRDNNLTRRLGTYHIIFSNYMVLCRDILCRDVMIHCIDLVEGPLTSHVGRTCRDPDLQPVSRPHLSFLSEGTRPKYSPASYVVFLRSSWNINCVSETGWSAVFSTCVPLKM